MSQNTGRVKPGRKGRNPMARLGRPTEPARSDAAKTTRTPAGVNLGTLVSGRTQGRRGR